MQSIVLRPGLKPCEQSRKSFSQIGSINILNISCTTRSLIVGIPRGRFSLFPGLGIHVLRTGIGS